MLLVLEGGPGTLKTVCGAIDLEPPVPVVIIKDSGRAADVIAYALSNINDELYFQPGEYHTELWNMMTEVFTELKSEEQKQDAYKKILACVRKKDSVRIMYTHIHA